MAEYVNPIPRVGYEGLSPERTTISEKQQSHCVECVKCGPPEIPFGHWNEREIWVRAHNQGTGHHKFILFSSERLW